MLSLQSLFVPLLLLAGLFGPGWLGVYLAEDDSGRIMVSEVVASSPAQKAGLKAGDVILAIDGKSATSVEAFIDVIKTREAGSKVKLTLGRDSGDTVVEVTLGERPADAESGPRTVSVTPPARALETTKVAEAKVTEQKKAAEKAAEAKKADGAAVKTGAAPGVETKPMGRPYLGLALEETDRGVMITEVLKDGPAGKAKVPTGQLLAIGDAKIKTLADMDKAMAGVQPGRTLKLTVQGRAVETIDVVVGSVGDGERKSEVAAAPRAAAAAAQAERAKANAERVKVEAERAKVAAQAKAEEAAKTGKRGDVVKLEDVTESKSAAAADDPRAALRAARGKQPLALVFGASWDASTKALRKSFDDDKVKAALGERKVLWFDTDRFGALADEFKVQQIPHIVLLDKAGKQQRAIEGFQPAEALAAVVGAGEFVGGQAPIPVRLPARARTAPAAAAQPDMKPEAKPETKAEPKPQARTSDRDLEQEIRELRMEIRELRQTLRELLNERRRE